jgi:hypothetical protein
MLFPVVLRPWPKRLAVVRINGGMRCDLTLEPLDCDDPEVDFLCHLADARSPSRTRAAPDRSSRARHRGGQASCGTLPALLTYLPSRAIFSLITLSPARTAYCSVAHRLPRTFCWEFLGDTS